MAMRPSASSIAEDPGLQGLCLCALAAWSRRAAASSSDGAHDQTATAAEHKEEDEHEPVSLTTTSPSPAVASEPLKLRMPPGVGGFVAVMAFQVWRRLRTTVRNASLKPVRTFLRRIRMLQLPGAARQQLLVARSSLMARSKAVPPAFRRSLGDAASKLEDLPTFLFEVTLLSAQLTGGSSAHLEKARTLGEGLSILFAAGRMHLLHQEGGGPTRLLGGDYLYAEGQWLLAELGCLPVIKLSTQTIREFSDSALHAQIEQGALPKEAKTMDLLHYAFRKTGAFFATAAGGGAWLMGAPQEQVLALYRYGGEFGCALELVRSLVDHPVKGDILAHEVAFQLAISARKAARELRSLLDPVAARGLYRLARAVEAEAFVCIASAAPSCGGRDAATREMVLEELRTFRSFLDRSAREVDPPGKRLPTETPVMTTLGLRRSGEADEALQRLIAVGLEDSSKQFRSPEWPPGGPKKALAKSFGCIVSEQAHVNHLLDSGELSKGAWCTAMQDEAATMLRSGGKRLRPALALLVARALGASKDGLEKVSTLGAAVEVLHGGSLVHDDILDEADSRRGQPTLHLRRGELQAVLVGDYLFAVSSALIAGLESIPAIQLMSKVIADFGRGELAQSALKYQVANYSLIDYLAKSFHKTASLLAAACQSAAVLASVDAEGHHQRSPNAPEAEACYRYGMYVGLAFQVVDDILDFTQTDTELGKPALADLKAGYVSAPVLLSLQGDDLQEDQKKEITVILERKLSQEADLETILGLIGQGSGVEKSKALAKKYAALAIGELHALPRSEARSALETFADFVVARTY